MTPLDRRIRTLRDRAVPPMPDHGPTPRGLAGIALAQAADDPDRLAVIDGDRHLSRAELLDAALRLGGALQHRGLRPGSAVAFQLPNWWEACVISLAAALFGYRLVPLLTIYRRAELNTILGLCAVEALFVPDRFRGTDFPAVVRTLDAPPRHVFVLRGASGCDLGRLLTEAPARAQPAATDDARLVLFTSGSTGRPKGVVHSHAAMEHLITRTAAFWGTLADDVLYVPSPVGHIGGLIYAVDFPWMTGCTAILAETWDPDEAVRRIEAGGATFMAGATPFLQGLIAAADRAGTRLPGLRRFVCGGASVAPELVRRGLDTFANAIVSRAYGSTEVPLICPGIRTRDEAGPRADTDGEVAVDLRLLADDGTPAPEGAIGEIAARAPQMLMGYLDPADEAGCLTRDGFFVTGDLGRRVEGRFLEITGRRKDIIIRKGENISPLEIENALMRHPAVRVAAVVGIPDAERGEMVVAFVVPQPGTAFDFPAMTAHLRGLDLARQKFPERLQVVESLPVNAVGKVQKPALRAMAIAAADTAGAHEPEPGA